MVAVGGPGRPTMAAHRCRYCGRFFRPHPRKRGGSPQKTCGRDPCRRANERRRLREWIGRNPGYQASRRPKTRAWARAYPDYWRRYRRKHRDYARRDNLRRSAAIRRGRRSAKQTVIREILVEKLLAVKRIRPRCSAKQTVMTRRVDALVDVLVWRERSAKQSVMAGWGPTAGQWSA